MMQKMESDVKSSDNLIFNFWDNSFRFAVDEIIQCVKTPIHNYNLHTLPLFRFNNKARNSKKLIFLAKFQ